MRNVARFIPLIIWIGLITYGSLMSGNRLPGGFLSGIPLGDKLAHFGAYFGMSFLAMIALTDNPHVGRRVVLWVVITCASWGLLIEGLQLAMAAGRHFEVFDIIANIIGTLFGVAAYIILYKKKVLWK